MKNSVNVKAGGLPERILAHYGIFAPVSVNTYGAGLINRTWLVETLTDKFILQRINDKVFADPAGIAGNIAKIQSYLRQNNPEYFLVAPMAAKDGSYLTFDGAHGFFRMFPFVRDSRTYQVVTTPAQAYEAARQFSLFTRVLSGFDTKELSLSIPGFHDLPARFGQFQRALLFGNEQRKRRARSEINFLRSRFNLVAIFEKIKGAKDFRVRVMHHDTKISNVLFDANDRGVCVIDLDTVMPGYFFSDVGDMLRTYLSPVNEEEADVGSIEVRDDYFRAVAEGYLSEMGAAMSDAELSHFLYAGKFMIYMQALRFLTDFLQDDRYYGAAYEDQNYVRSRNQIALLQRLEEKEVVLNESLRVAGLRR